VGPSGESVAFSNDIPVVVTWALWIAGPGALLLIVLLFVKIRRERSDAD
jgi:cytochrome c-type biogenesis protein CcmH/NrfF